MTNTVQSGRVRFAAFEVDFRSCELFKYGIRIKLQDQPFQILAILLERPGEMVSREELRKRLWAEDTFVDFDAGLNAAIRRLRDALNDSADAPRYIETLPRHGYRFLAPIETVPGSKPEPIAATPAKTQSPNGNDLTTPALQGERILDPNAAVAQPARLRLTWVSALAIAAGLVLLTTLVVSPWRLRLFSTHAASGIHSLAVLPLQNLSGDPNQEYFADGMTDALITDLANISSLRVVSRTSAMHYKGSHQPLPEIARELKVDAVVEGSVVHLGNRVRVNAQLVQANSDRHLWAKAYDRNVSEIPAVQQDLVHDIVREIRAKLTPTEARSLTSTRIVNPEAYEASLKGRYYWNKRSLDGFNKGLTLFQQAIRADPSYAPAYVGMAHCYNFLGLGMGSEPPREAARLAEAAAQKALELDENLADAHAALAFTLYRYDWNWAEAEQEYRRALELDPHNIIVRGWFADLLSFLGQAEEADTQRKQARDQDPFSIQTVRTIAGAYSAAKQYDKAIDYYKKAIESEPDNFRMRMDLGGDYLQAGRYQDAAEEFQTVLTLYGDNVYPLARLGYTYAIWGRTAEAGRILSLLKKQGRVGYVSYAIAEICEALGRKEETLRWLEKAYNERAAQMTGLQDGFSSLHSDPRFQDLVRRMGFPAKVQR